jgi:nitric oxide reductase activation protein
MVAGDRQGWMMIVLMGRVEDDSDEADEAAEADEGDRY